MPTPLPTRTDVGATPPDIAASTGTDWTLVLTVISLAFAGISAMAVIVGAVYWFRTRQDRAERAGRERQVSADVSEMSDRIERLQEIVDILATEERGRRPEPSVALRTRDGPATHILIKKPGIPEVDLESIIDSERDAALDTLPPVANSAPTGDRTLAIVEQMAAASRFFGFGREQLPVTEDDHARFHDKVDKYEDDLRLFIERWVAYLEADRRVMVLSAQIENNGGAPAEDVRVRLRFPDPCVRADFPKKPERPARPKFSPRRNPLYSSVSP
jgi:hypothetical protein